MVMELRHLNQGLYPRAVNASVEGQLRQDGQGRGLTPESTSSVKKGASTEIQHGQRRQLQRDATERQISNDQSTQRRNAEQERAIGGYAEASTFGDQLAVASRQARQSQTRRSYTPPAFESARGREANRRYLDVSSSNLPRFIDEVV